MTVIQTSFPMMLPVSTKMRIKFSDKTTLRKISGSGRRCGLMVSALDSGVSGPGLSPGRGHYVTLTVPLSAQVYKWVPANLMLGVTL